MLEQVLMLVDQLTLQHQLGQLVHLVLMLQLKLGPQFRLIQQVIIVKELLFE